MSARNTVWIERVDGKIIRIFRGTNGDEWKLAMLLGTLETCPKKDAVSAIWEALFERSAGKCEYGCGRTITRSGWNKGEMHEEIHRSMGGEISLANSKMICRSCHRNVAHGDRKPQFTAGKTFEEVMGEEQ